MTKKVTAMIPLKRMKVERTGPTSITVSEVELTNKRAHWQVGDVVYISRYGASEQLAIVGNFKARVLKITKTRILLEPCE